MDDRYSPDWPQLAIAKKLTVNWRCERCGRQCLKPEERQRFPGDVREKKRWELQVHHCDHNPANNAPENLRAVCSSCHLDYHRGGRGNIVPGQLQLPLGL